jgi:heavy metal efflux system protein
MWQRVALGITVVLLGLGGGILALFFRGMHAERGTATGFCFVSALAIVQAWIVTSGIAKACRLYSNVRNACYRGAQAKFRAVFVIGLCAIVGVLPLALIGASSGAQARFATVILGGVVFSTTAALTVLPSSSRGPQSKVGFSRRAAPEGTVCAGRQ